MAPSHLMLCRRVLSLLYPELGERSALLFLCCVKTSLFGIPARIHATKVEHPLCVVLSGVAKQITLQEFTTSVDINSPVLRGQTINLSRHIFAVLFPALAAARGGKRERSQICVVRRIMRTAAAYDLPLYQVRILFI